MTILKPIREVRLFSFIFQVYLYDDEDGVEAIDRQISVTLFSNAPPLQ